LAGELLRSTDQDWAAVLKKLRNGKGTVYTQALVASVNRLDGERRHEAREALAERLTRMTADTLRAMAKDEDIELRRAAFLAMAMKDDKSHISDLIAGLQDSEEVVVRAAKAGLKSLAGEDFGPAVNATAGEKKLAAAAWKEWLEKQKK
jgi:HEAT repeat protein